MATFRKIASEIATDIKAVNLDDKISFRYILSKFQSKVESLLRIDSRSREMFKDITLWKTIKCVKMEEVPRIMCGDIACDTIRRSEIELPEAMLSSYGLLMKVIPIDNINGIEFKLINKFDYKDYTTREYAPANMYIAWIDEKRLYIPNLDIEAVDILIVPKSKLDIDILNNLKNTCLSPLDGEVPYPDYLIAIAKTETLKEIVSPYKQIVEDEKGDDNTNIKS